MDRDIRLGIARITRASAVDRESTDALVRFWRATFRGLKAPQHRDLEFYIVNLMRRTPTVFSQTNPATLFPTPKIVSHPLYRRSSVIRHMDSSLLEVWQSAKGSAFVPAVGKDSQFVIGFALLLVGLSLTGGFALSMDAVQTRVLCRR